MKKTIAIVVLATAFAWICPTGAKLPEPCTLLASVASLPPPPPAITTSVNDLPA